MSRARLALLCFAPAFVMVVTTVYLQSISEERKAEKWIKGDDKVLEVTLRDERAGRTIHLTQEQIQAVLTQLKVTKVIKLQPGIRDYYTQRHDNFSVYFTCACVNSKGEAYSGTLTLWLLTETCWKISGLEDSHVYIDYEFIKLCRKMVNEAPITSEQIYERKEQMRKWKEYQEKPWLRWFEKKD